MKYFLPIIVIVALSLNPIRCQTDETTTTATTTTNAPPVTEAPAECTAPGLFCESCESLVLCVQHGPGNFSKSHVDTCKSGTKCLTNACTWNADWICDRTDKLDFVCKNVGIFPDQFDCGKYVMCVSDGTGTITPHHETCDAGYGFNNANGLCDIKLKEAVGCNGYPIPVCQTAGIFAGFVQKKAMYYACEEYSEGNLSIYPFLYLCDSGTVFHNNSSCA